MGDVLSPSDSIIIRVRSSEMIAARFAKVRGLDFFSLGITKSCIYVISYANIYSHDFLMHSLTVNLKLHPFAALSFEPDHPDPSFHLETFSEKI